VASDKKRCNTKAVPDVPEPLVIGVTCARVYGVPKEPGASGTTGTAAGGLILPVDLGATTGWALRTADGTILSGTVSFRPSHRDGGMRDLRFRSWLGQMVRGKFGEWGRSAAA
jgi:hypothetical protein